jgi:hypothetical protein
MCPSGPTFRHCATFSASHREQLTYHRDLSLQGNPIETTANEPRKPGKVLYRSPRKRLQATPPSNAPTARLSFASVSSMMSPALERVRTLFSLAGCSASHYHGSLSKPASVATRTLWTTSFTPDRLHTVMSSLRVRSPSASALASSASVPAARLGYPAVLASTSSAKRSYAGSTS